MKHPRLNYYIIALLLMTTVILCCRLNFDGKGEGLYLLKGASGKLFELKDNLLLGEYERLIGKIEFQALYERWRSKERAAQGRAYIKYSWSMKSGNGYFINFFPDGTKLLACFGGFIDDFNKPVKGLFVGGGLPKSHYENAELKTNETGVAFFDGNTWHHLRRNTEEAIFSVSNPSLRIKPGKWEFLGSKVIFATQFRLALKSSHLARIGPISVRIDRYLMYHAGDSFFTLANRLTNMGTAPLDYHYIYGNEQWEGSYDSSANNTGWSSENSRPILPSRAETMVLTMGMADNDPKTGLQCKPEVTPDPSELQYLLDH